MACIAYETTQATSALPILASVCKQNPIPQEPSIHLAFSSCSHPVPGFVWDRLKAAQQTRSKGSLLRVKCARGVPWSLTCQRRAQCCLCPSFPISQPQDIQAADLGVGV